MGSLTPARQHAACARPPQPATERALTARSLFTGLSLVLVWTLAVCYMVVYVSTFTYQLLMIMGFGALLTIFLLHFPRLYLASLAFFWAGTASLSWMASTPDQKQLLIGGLLRSLPVLALLAAIGAMQMRRRMSKAEAAAVYAMVAIAIPWSVSIKACIESSVSNLLDSNRRQEKQAYQWARDMPWWAPTMQPPAGQAEHEARVLAALAQAIQNDDEPLRTSLLALPPTMFYYNDHRDVLAQMAALKPAREAWQKEPLPPAVRGAQHAGPLGHAAAGLAAGGRAAAGGAAGLAGRAQGAGAAVGGAGQGDRGLLPRLAGRGGALGPVVAADAVLGRHVRQLHRDAVRAAADVPAALDRARAAAVSVGDAGPVGDPGSDREPAAVDRLADRRGPVRAGDHLRLAAGRGDRADPDAAVVRPPGDDLRRLRPVQPGPALQDLAWCCTGARSSWRCTCCCRRTCC